MSELWDKKQWEKGGWFVDEIKQTEILLESGTNELEIMEFTIGEEVFGINVAKIREILRLSPIKPMQKAHPDVEGI